MGIKKGVGFIFGHLTKGMNIERPTSNFGHPSFVVNAFETIMGHRCTQINTDRFIC